MADTPLATLSGILALARLAEGNHLHIDGRDRRMLGRVMEALIALPPAVEIDIALALARQSRDGYTEIDADLANGRIPLDSGTMPALIVALETIVTARAVA